jgi:hypothetical protein
MINVGISLNNKIDKANKLVNSLLSATKKRVLVGVPQEDPDRWKNEDGKRKPDSTINNAALAYIHDNGSPKANIPPRPFMIPGIQSVQERINASLLAAAQAALEEDKGGVDIHLNKAGLIAQNGIRKVINQGEGFDPLKRETKLARLRRRKATREWSKERREEVLESMHPLIDTGQLRNSITYVIENLDTGERILGNQGIGGSGD